MTTVFPGKTLTGTTTLTPQVETETLATANGPVHKKVLYLPLLIQFDQCGNTHIISPCSKGTSIPGKAFPAALKHVRRKMESHIQEQYVLGILYVCLPLCLSLYVCVCV